jgi:hypothetical protein
MRLLFNCLTAILLSTGAVAQTTNSNSTSQSNQTETSFKKESTSKTEFSVPTSLFVDNLYPSDLPLRKDYKTDEIYFKVIQGYINNYSDKVVKEEALKLGFTFPQIIDTKNESDRHQSRKRTTTISQEEKELKEAKQLELKKN